MSDLDKMLSPGDADILDTVGRVNWVPKEPLETLLPYMEKSPSVEKTSIETRREKAKKVMKGYDELIDKSKQLESEIIERCKNVKVPLNRGSHLSVIQAIARTFQIPEDQITEITFDMYKTCIEKLDAINGERIPLPEGQKTS